MIRRRIFWPARSLVQLLGLDIVRFSDLARRVDARRLRAYADRQVDTVLDVGAAEGNFGQKLRDSGFSGRIVSFEPVSDSYRALARVARRDGQWDAINVAIGDEDGSATINVSGRHTSSSLLPMAAKHVEAAPDSAYVRTETVRVQRLDTALVALGSPPGPFSLKIDVQGLEASVLAGAKETLTRTRVLEVELSMVSLYQGGPLYTGMIGHLDSLGFRLVSWEDVLNERDTGYVLQADAIFVRE